MSCSACQEQKIEVDLGCQHFYCRACLEHLGGKCRDGCTPQAKIPVQDAREILEYLEGELKTLELEAIEEITRLKEKFDYDVLRVKGRVHRRHLEVKKAEMHVETLVVRSQSEIQCYPLTQYAKVHLESNCNKYPITSSRYFLSSGGIAGNFHMSLHFGMNDGWIPDLKLVGFKNCFQYGREWLSIIAKSRDKIALDCKRSSTSIIILDINKQTVVESFAKFPETDLLFFKDGELTSCPVPDGFEYTAGNIAIRPHATDSHMFELFDPAVGQLELFIANVCRKPVRYFYGKDPKLNSNLELRTDVLLDSGHCIGIPYLD